MISTRKEPNRLTIYIKEPCPDPVRDHGDASFRNERGPEDPPIGIRGDQQAPYQDGAPHVLSYPLIIDKCCIYSIFLCL